MEKYRENGSIMFTSLVFPARSLFRHSKWDGVLVLLALVHAAALFLFPAPPVIALTAYGNPDDPEEMLRQGFRIFLSKPVDPTSLADAVASLARGDEGDVNERSKTAAPHHRAV